METEKILGDKVRIWKKGIEDIDFATVHFDGLIVSRVLYYLSDKTLQDITDYVLPTCKVVLMINGTREKKVKSNSWDFWDRNQGMKFLDSFNRELEMGAERASYRIIATR